MVVWMGGAVVCIWRWRRGERWWWWWWLFVAWAKSTFVKTHMHFMRRPPYASRHHRPLLRIAASGREHPSDAIIIHHGTRPSTTLSTPPSSAYPLGLPLPH